jgi:hypothetical protein
LSVHADVDAHSVDYDPASGLNDLSMTFGNRDTAAGAGVPLGPQQKITNWLPSRSCPSGQTYQFDSAVFPDGIPEYCYNMKCRWMPATNFLWITTPVQSASFRPCIALCEVKVTYTYEPPPPATIAFDFGSGLPEQQVLIHKYRNDDTYPLGNRQIPATSTTGPRVKVVVTLNGPGAANRTVWFRVVDPPDKSPYVPAADRKYGDNQDAAKRNGLLFVTDVNGNITGGGTSGVLQTTSRPDGGVNLLLETTSSNAGDNYQIEASFNPSADFYPLSANQPCASCSKSAIYTTWKRVYYEYRRMFRQGSYITEKPKTAAGGTTIWPVDMSPFPVGQNFTVRLIHAPRLDRVFLIALGGLIDEPFWSEDRVVHVVPQATTSAGTISPAHLEITSGSPLAHDYGIDSTFKPQNGPPLPYLADAVGFVGTGNDFFDADLNLVTGMYDTAFVEYQAILQTTTEWPNHRNLQGGTAYWLSQKWKEAALQLGTDRLSAPNTMHIYGGSEIPDPNNPVNNQPGAELGVTHVGGGTNRSMIWTGRIETAVTQANQNVFSLSPANVNREVVVHELAHQWRVNAGSPDGHCLEDAYVLNGTFCGMHRSFYIPAHNPELGDGIILFHYSHPQNAAVDSEYMTIRNAAEPVPQQ